MLLLVLLVAPFWLLLLLQLRLRLTFVAWIVEVGSVLVLLVIGVVVRSTRLVGGIVVARSGYVRAQWVTGWWLRDWRGGWERVAEI